MAQRVFLLVLESLRSGAWGARRREAGPETLRRQRPRGTVGWAPARPARFLGPKGKFLLLLPARVSERLRQTPEPEVGEAGRRVWGRWQGNTTAKFERGVPTGPTAPKQRSLCPRPGSGRAAGSARSPGGAGSVRGAWARLSPGHAAREGALGTGTRSRVCFGLSWGRATAPRVGEDSAGSRTAPRCRLRATRILGASPSAAPAIQGPHGPLHVLKTGTSLPPMDSVLQTPAWVTARSKLQKVPGCRPAAPPVPRTASVFEFSPLDPRVGHRRPLCSLDTKLVYFVGGPQGTRKHTR